MIKKPLIACLFVAVLVFTKGNLPAQELPQAELSLSERNEVNHRIPTGFPYETVDLFDGAADQQSVSAGGLFISPFLGFDFPLQEFSNNSKGTFDFGVKLEIAHSKIYPFIVGGIFQYQSHEGTEEIKTANFLSTFKTNITSFGGTIDIILNKFIKSDFTIPFATIEVKFMNVERVITPENFNPGFETKDNVIGITGGLGFTVYIFDLYTTYTYAGDYSTFGVKTRFHFPVIKF